MTPPSDNPVQVLSESLTTINRLLDEIINMYRKEIDHLKDIVEQLDNKCEALARQNTLDRRNAQVRRQNPRVRFNRGRRPPTSWNAGNRVFQQQNGQTTRYKEHRTNRGRPTYYRRGATVPAQKQRSLDDIN